MREAERPSLFFTEAMMLVRYPVGGLIVGFGIAWVSVAWWTMEDMRDRFPDQPTQATLAGAAAIGMGVLIVCGGLWFMLIRAGTLLDRRTRTVYTLAGPLGLLRKPRASFDEVKIVRIRRAVIDRRPTEAGLSQEFGKTRHVTYPVELVTAGSSIHLFIPMTYRAARRGAEQAADFLGVGVEDTTGGEATVREAGELDVPLGERLGRATTVVDLPDPPPGLEPLVGQEDGRWVIERPPIAFGREHRRVLGIAALIGLVGAAGFAVIELLEEGPATLPGVLGGALPAFALPLAIVLLIVGRAVCTSELIEVSAEGVTVRKSLAGLKRAVTLAAAEIEQVEVKSDEKSDPKSADFYRVMGVGPTVRIVSDRKTVEFGSGLTEPELRWITDLIRKALAEGHARA